MVFQSKCSSIPKMTIHRWHYWERSTTVGSIDTAKKSLKKLTQYDIETVICYHGGVYKDNINQCLLELARE